MTEAKVARQSRNALLEAVAREERKELMPRVMFEMMVLCKQLERAGCDVMCDLYAEVPTEHCSRDEYGMPGVVFRFNSEKAHGVEDWRDVVEYETLTVLSEGWKVEMLKKRFAELQLAADETTRQKALAAEAKKLLTPEQLAALKQHG